MVPVVIVPVMMAPVMMAEVVTVEVMTVRVVMPLGRPGQTHQPRWRAQDPHDHHESERVAFHLLLPVFGHVSLRDAAGADFIL
jgi:hypothetical protein